MSQRKDEKRYCDKAYEQPAISQETPDATCMSRPSASRYVDNYVRSHPSAFSVKPLVEYAWNTYAKEPSW